MKKQSEGENRKKWLKERQKGIGGSDVAAILGVSRWKSALDVYNDKVAEEPEEIEENDAIHWGNILEPIVAKEFSNLTGLKIRVENKILEHPEYKFMKASVDRRVVGKETTLLECKTAHFYKAKEWENDEIPPEYILQCMHYLAVTGYDYMYIAVLIGGSKFIYKKIDRNEELVKIIIDKCKNFWYNHVIPRKPPSVDGSEACKKALDEKLKWEDTLKLDLKQTNEINELIEKLNEVKEQSKIYKDHLKVLDASKNELESSIKSILGAKGQVSTGEYLITYKDYEVKERLTKAYTYAKMNIKANKK